MRIDFDKLGLTLRAEAKAGAEKIVAYCAKRKVSPLHTAYILATTYWETGRWMQPIREGATRFGPNYTDAQSRAAVATIYAKKIIKTNYALPAGPYKQSYYGRGLVQITWYDNYKKFADLLKKPLDKTPDLALDWDIALDIAYLGMRDGMFRKKKLDMIKSESDYTAARGIINGDRHGAEIAKIAIAFHNAIK